MHNETKNALDALQIQYTGCKEELKIVQEEKERLNIKVIGHHRHIKTRQYKYRVSRDI